MQAGMADTEVEFVRKTVFTAFYITTGVLVSLALLLSKIDVSVVFIIFISPFFFIMMFFYFLKFPDMRIMRIERDINKEIVYAGRFLVIELESGIPIYEAFKHVAKNYPVIGKYFNNIIHDMDMGTTIDVALNKAVELTPSQNFRRVLWQIIDVLYDCRGHPAIHRSDYVRDTCLIFVDKAVALDASDNSGADGFCAVHVLYSGEEFKAGRPVRVGYGKEEENRAERGACC
jgi:hypothetical protein